MEFLIVEIYMFLDIEFLPGTDNYQPILYFNDYWNLNTDYMPINQTTP